MPMPIDLLVEYNDGTMESVPLRMMSYEKENPIYKKNGAKRLDLGSNKLQLYNC
jgi:hypothetical protein